MRISTSQMQTVGVNAMLDQQVKLSKTQVQVASGQRIMLPSDDPVGTSQMLTLQQTLDTTVQCQANGNAALNRLSLEDGVLKEMTSLLHRARELTIQGKNATQTDETRRAMGVEVRQLLAQLVGLANTKDGSGDYLFAGGKGDTQPFSQTAAGYSYFGDQTQRLLQIAPARQIADGDPGSSVFQMVRNGNGTFVTEGSATNTGTGVIVPGTVSGTFVPTITGAGNVNGVTLRFTSATTWEARATGDGTLISAGTYVDGQAITVNGATVSITGAPATNDTFEIRSSEYQDLFTTLENLAKALETPAQGAASGAQLQNALNRTLVDLDQGFGSILETEASVGARINAIESQQNINDGTWLQTTQILSSIKDLDYAEAVSRLNQQTVGLQASQQAYLKVNGLSLFNFLK